MNPEQMTEQILDAWNEADETPPVETPDEETTVEGAEVETPEEDDDETTEEEGAEEGDDEETPAEDPDAEEEDEEVAEEEDDPEIVAEYSDPEILAFLTKFQGDTERALRYGVQAQRSLSDLGQQRTALSRRVAELESQLQDARAFQSDTPMLSEEQRSWVGDAIDSGNPTGYVREAVRAGEFGLARAILNEYGRENAFEALRLSQQVDAAEADVYAAQTPEPQPVNREALLGVLAEHYPEMPQYEEQMVEAMHRLGPLNQSVIDAQSSDPETAARGIINLYDIARASTTMVASSKEKLKNGRRAKSDEARTRAAVATSAGAPSPGQTPRATKLGPGLTLEQLDAEWERTAAGRQ